MPDFLRVCMSSSLCRCLFIVFNVHAYSTVAAEKLHAIRRSLFNSLVYSPASHNCQLFSGTNQLSRLLGSNLCKTVAEMKQAAETRTRQGEMKQAAETRTRQGGMKVAGSRDKDKAGRDGGSRDKDMDNAVWYGVRKVRRQS